MKNKALNELNKLNKTLDDIFSLIEPVHDDEFYKKPSSNEWSVSQIFNHLLEIEQNCLDYIEFKEQEGKEFTKESIKTKFRFFVYKIALLSPLRFKIPATLSHPDNTGDFQTFQSQFSDLRNSLYHFTERQKPHYFTKAGFKHPIVGRITLQKMFVFLNIHMKHHKRQILRTLIKIARSN